MADRNIGHLFIYTPDGGCNDQTIGHKNLHTETVHSGIHSADCYISAMFETVPSAPGHDPGLLYLDGNENAFERIDGDLDKGLVIICDHASNHVPAAYENLGLPETEFARHIAYDIGAANVARGIAITLGVPAVLSRFSRILIDPNRGPEDPTLVMKLSDGAVIPGNRHVDEAEILKRRKHYYDPYHTEIDRLLEEGIERGKPPAIFSVHSFTPFWKSVMRPWHATVLWDKDDRLPRPVMKALRAEKGLVTDDNVPYSGELRGDCMYRHGTQRGLAHALIEIRQELISDEAGASQWAKRLSMILQGCLGLDGLNEIRFFGSNADK